MRSPVHAIGWEFRKRHAWPLITLVVYLLVLAAIKLLGFGPIAAITVVPLHEKGAALIAPVSTVFMYYLGVFSFGLTGDLAARQSIYPTRLFTLPVGTEALVLAPMLYGTAAVAILVQAATLVARWPWGIDTPFIWPALLAAVFLAWTQALTWMPYGLRGVRVVFTVVWLASLDAVVLLAMYFKVSEPVMLGILAPQLPLAYLVACYAVGRARRGEVPDWRPGFMRIASTAGAAPVRRAALGSPGRAQLWFEWRRQGRTLPALVAIALPFELALFWMAPGAPELLLELLVLALITPPLLASFTAATVSTANPAARDSGAMSPFMATRPLSSAELIAAKLNMAVGSTLATWLLVLVAIGLALIWSGTWPMVERRANRLVELVGLPGTMVAAAMVLLGLIASTWKQLVQGMFIGLAGRAWIRTATGIAALVFIVVISPVLQWKVS